MKIMYVTSECAPFIKTGGLGDVAGSLPQALAAKGHDVRVFCPLYSAIDQSMREKFYYIKNAYVRLGWRNQYCGIFRYEADGVTYYFIDNEYYFARGQIYGEYDDAERFAYYSKAVLEVLPDLEWKPDVINCNDWQTALVPVYYNLMFASRPFYENIKTVFTIHNIQYQGRYGREILEYVLGIDDAHFRSGFMAMDGDVNLMKAAIVASTAVTTVSPTYANEIQTEYYGYRLDSVLRMNSYKLHGILNGINMDAFNPETDSKIFKNYGPNNPQDKLVNKTELLKLCGLEGDANTPVIGIVTRFVDQTGISFLLKDVRHLEAHVLQGCGQSVQHTEVVGVVAQAAADKKFHAQVMHLTLSVLLYLILGFDHVLGQCIAHYEGTSLVYLILGSVLYLAGKMSLQFTCNGFFQSGLCVLGLWHGLSYLLT